MILTDTGPLVALFDRSDNFHGSVTATHRRISEPLATTLPVLTETFHLLGAGSMRASALIEFVQANALLLLHLDGAGVTRAFELMARFANMSMDFADASLICMAERHGTRQVFTLDFNDFSAYRVKKGFRYMPFEIVELQ